MSDSRIVSAFSALSPEPAQRIAEPGHGAPGDGARSNEVVRRLLTAGVALPVVCWAVMAGGVASATLFSVASVGATREFLRLVRPAGADRAMCLLAAAALPWLPLIAPHRSVSWAFALVMAVSFLSWATLAVRQDVKGVSMASLPLQALVFCASGLFCLSALRQSNGGEIWVLSVVGASFANDAFAYGGGRWLGRHPLAPRVSPHKTWEGWAFGALGSATVSVVAVVCFPGVLRVSDGVALAIVSAIIGPLGDLSKSLLKRARGVKDTGRLLPGHGGILDRIDALLVNASAMWLWHLGWAG